MNCELCWQSVGGWVEVRPRGEGDDSKAHVVCRECWAGMERLLAAELADGTLETMARPGDDSEVDDEDRRFSVRTAPV